MKNAEEFKRTDKWWIAMTYVSGAALTSAVFGLDDQLLRRRAVELFLGGLMLGLGEWMSRGFEQEIVDQNGHRLLLTRETRSWALAPLAIQIGGILLIGRALWWFFSTGWK